jgi:hypothetical protein
LVNNIPITFSNKVSRSEVPKLWGMPPPGGGGALLVLWWGGRQVVCGRDIFNLNEIWTQDKNVYFCSHFACLKYFTYRLLLVLILAPNFWCKQHILLQAEVINVYYLLGELHVKILLHV